MSNNIECKHKFNIYFEEGVEHSKSHYSLPDNMVTYKKAVGVYCEKCGLIKKDGE